MRQLQLYTHHLYRSDLVDNGVLMQTLARAGMDTRRLSKSSLAVLYTVLPLLPYLHSDTALYLGTPFQAGGRFVQMCRRHCLEGLPSPLDFSATLHNAPLFHLARYAHTTGNSTQLAVSACNSGQLWQAAWLDISCAHAETALLVWCEEPLPNTGLPVVCYACVAGVIPKPQPLARIEYDKGKSGIGEVGISLSAYLQQVFGKLDNRQNMLWYDGSGGVFTFQAA